MKVKKIKHKKIESVIFFRRAPAPLQTEFKNKTKQKKPQPPSCSGDAWSEMFCEQSQPLLLLLNARFKQMYIV